MIKSIYDDSSLNSLYDSNATCELRLWKDDAVSSGLDEIVGMNSLISSIRDAPESVRKNCRKAYESHANCNVGAIETVKLCRMESRRRAKILYALFDRNLSIQTHYLNEVSIELMPRVISYIDEGSKWTGAEDKNLDRLFQLVLSRPDSMVSFAVARQKEEEEQEMKEHGLSLESKIIAGVVAVVSAFVGIITATTIRWYRDA